MLRIGILGCGRVAEERHLPALRTLPEADVVAAADTDPARLKYVADRFHIPHRFTAMQPLLTLSTVDVIAVCLPPALHVEAAVAALQAGKHVFIEKPLALSLDDTDRLLTATARSDRTVMVGFNLRWHRLVRRARDAIRRGDVGQVSAVRTVFTAPHRPPTDLASWRARLGEGGGVLLELGVHHFDLWRFLLDAEVEEVLAVRAPAAEVDNSVVVSARMASGVLATSLFSAVGVGSNEVEVIGERNRLRFSCYRFDSFELQGQQRSLGGVRERTGSMLRKFAELPYALRAARYGGEFQTSYREEWHHFLGAIQTRTTVECTVDDGRRALEVTLAAAAAGVAGRAILVSAAPRDLTALVSA